MAGTLADGDGGNSATLIKVDRLRELIGNKISLPQLVVVGDQSSGKSSVLEGITGFAFPRDAELCTRYATQITCRREDRESVTVTIIPNEDADPDVAAKLKSFSRTLPEATQMDNKMLGEIFRDVNKELGVSSGSGDVKTEAGNAFSEHLLKIEICGPQQKHFTVIDVPGIFRKETQGVTTEADILLVKNMVMKYMRHPRTIILAIVPANVDPATQEILKLAKRVDPDMKRTMGVLTKPDLAIERVTQQIAIDHATGKRSDLTLGYYIIKNRGPDGTNLTLEEGRDAEAAFFAKEPWSAIRGSGRVGTRALQTKVRGLLTDLVKHEFKQLRTEVTTQLAEFRDEEVSLGQHRSDPHAQRAYLLRVCDRIQSIMRDGLVANYTNHPNFFSAKNNRLITRIVQLDEQFSAAIREYGHTRAFVEPKDSVSPKSRSRKATKPAPTVAAKIFPIISKMKSACPKAISIAQSVLEEVNVDNADSIMDYIKSVRDDSRGADLGTFNSAILAAAFQEQTKNWEPITEAYINLAMGLVASFIRKMIFTCTDPHIAEELFDNLMEDRLEKCFNRARHQVEMLLVIERKNPSFTLNQHFNRSLSKLQGDRLTTAIYSTAEERSLDTDGSDSMFMLTPAQLGEIAGHNHQANAEKMHEYIHDVLASYYKVAMKRYIDSVCLQAIHHHLLYSQDSPLHILNPELIHSLDDAQLDQYAGEDHGVRSRREKLTRDIQSYREALEVLKGTSSKAASQ